MDQNNPSSQHSPSSWRLNKMRNPQLGKKLLVLSDWNSFSKNVSELLWSSWNTGFAAMNRAAWLSHFRWTSVSFWSPKSFSKVSSPVTSQHVDHCHGSVFCFSWRPGDNTLFLSFPGYWRVPEQDTIACGGSPSVWTAGPIRIAKGCQLCSWTVGHKYPLTGWTFQIPYHMQSSLHMLCGRVL